MMYSINDPTFYTSLIFWGGRYGERMFEYNVVTVDDNIFSFGDNFNPKALTTLINKEASSGWRLVQSTSSDSAGWSGKHRQIVLIFERPISN